MDNNKVHQRFEIKPKFFYGYTVVAVAFLIIVMSWGLYNVFGVFLKPLLTEFGWTTAMTSGAFSLSVVLHGVLGIVMGKFTDRFGPRIVLTLCGFILGLGYLLASQVNELWQLYLFYGVIVGIGMGGSWVPLVSCVARWFIKRRSLMTGITVSGVGIGTLIAPPVISRLIAAYDWRLSYLILGAAILLVTVSAAQFLKRDPTQMDQLPYGANEEKQQGLKLESQVLSLREAVHTMQFWLAFLVFFCLGFYMLSFTVHIVPHATDLGISVTNAANILATSGGVSIIGNFVLGGVADRIGNRQIFIIGLILVSAASLGLALAEEAWMLYLCSAVFGFAHGGIAASESPIVARLFGLSSHGLIFGVVGIGFTIGAAVGPFVTGYIFDLTSSYQVAFLVCVVVSAVGLIFSVMLRPTKKLSGRI